MTSSISFLLGSGGSFQPARSLPLNSGLQEPSSEPSDKTGRASRTLGQLWQVPTFFIGLVALLLVAATAPWRLDSAARQFDEDCDQLRLIYKNKDKLADSTSLAEEMVARAAMFPAK